MGSITDIPEMARKYRAELAVLLGRGNVDRFIAFFVIGLIVMAMNELPSGNSLAKVVLSWIYTICFLSAFVFVIVGFLSTPPAVAASRAMPLEGLLTGIIAGTAAAMVGGACYYALNVQGCSSHDAVTKLVRLLPNCLILGCFLGSLFGKFPPFLGPRRTARPEEHANPNHPRGAKGAESTRIADYIVFLIFLSALIAALAYVDNAPSSRLSSVFGAAQGNIVFWQYLVIIGTFIIVFVCVADVKFKWSRQAGAASGQTFCRTLARSALAVLPSGLLLALLFGNVDIEAREGVGGPADCSHAYWADNSYPVVIFRIFVLFAWLYLTTYLSFTSRLQRVDKLFGGICRNG